MSGLIDEVKTTLASYNGEWKEKRGLWMFSAVIAERKAFLSKKRLNYVLRLRVDDAARVVRFSEMLNEAGSGFSSGGDLDGGISTGFGVKTETYNTFKGPLTGTIEEQSRLFGREYTYTFDYAEIRGRIKLVVEKYGFSFDYQVLPVK